MHAGIHLYLKKTYIHTIYMHVCCGIGRAVCRDNMLQLLQFGGKFKYYYKGSVLDLKGILGFDVWFREVFVFVSLPYMSKSCLRLRATSVRF